MTRTTYGLWVDATPLIACIPNCAIHLRSTVSRCHNSLATTFAGRLALVQNEINEDHIAVSSIWAVHGNSTMQPQLDKFPSVRPSSVQR